VCLAGGDAVRSGFSRELRHGRKKAKDWLDSTVRDVYSSRIFWQAVVSVFIFFLVVGISRLPLATAGLVVSGVRYVVTDEYDFVAVTKNLPSVEHIRENYIQKIVDWLRSTRPRTPAPAKEVPIWPVEGKVISGYGWRIDPETNQERLHEGIDIETYEAAPVKAVLSGVVVSVRESPTYGKVVEIDHGEGLVTLYAHLSKITVPVTARVKQGDTIGLAGMTGNASSVHLHFEVIENGRTQDPLKKLFEGGI